jgi:hypothetical protein
MFADAEQALKERKKGVSMGHRRSENVGRRPLGSILAECGCVHHCCGCCLFDAGVYGKTRCILEQAAGPDCPFVNIHNLRELVSRAK